MPTVAKKILVINESIKGSPNSFLGGGGGGGGGRGLAERFAGISSGFK